MPLETKLPKAGDKVRLVTAKLARVEATVEKVHKSGHVDLVATVDGIEHLITASPHDAGAQTPDSWHHAAVEKDEPAKEPGK